MDKHTIFQGITGSVAYRLATPTSDIDRKSVFVAPIEDVIGLRQVTETYTRHDPDEEEHEVGKFLRLALKCNPTILELLFLPADCVEHADPVWHYLVANRDRFLFEDGVRNAYGGYAVQQIRRIEAKMRAADVDRSRIAKHVRHCFRLFWQGEQLLTTGEMNVRLTAEQRERAFELGELSVEDVQGAFEAEKTVFDAVVSGLPDRSDFEWAHEFLVTLRRGGL